MLAINDRNTVQRMNMHVERRGVGWFSKGRMLASNIGESIIRS